METFRRDLARQCVPHRHGDVRPVQVRQGERPVLLDSHRGLGLRHHQRGVGRQGQALQLCLRLHPLLPDDLHHADFQTLCRFWRDGLQLHHAVCGFLHLVEKHEPRDSRSVEKARLKPHAPHQLGRHRGGHHRCRSADETLHQ